MTNDQLRDIAYNWHGGQGSALYAFASSGIIAAKQALLAEIEQNLTEVSINPDRYEMPQERDRLTELMEYVNSIGHFAGWAKREHVESFLRQYAQPREAQLALDEMVNEEFSCLASQINNDGTLAQLHYLLNQGNSPDDILARVREAQH